MTVRVFCDVCDKLWSQPEFVPRVSTDITIAEGGQLKLNWNDVCDDCASKLIALLESWKATRVPLKEKKR